MVKEMGFRSSDDQGKVTSYDRGHIHHQIYLALRAVIRSHLRQTNPDPPLELTKHARGARKWTPDPGVRRMFEEDSGEGVAFEDDNDDGVELEDLG